MAGYNQSIVSFFQRNRKLAEWLYNISYFPQLETVDPVQLRVQGVTRQFLNTRSGLMRHDAVRKYDPIVKEAVKRLPADVAAQRQFRISRALHLSYKNTVLPRKEWMTIDKDVPYLDPYIAQVKKEVEAKKKFQKEILSFKMPVKKT